jgi:hypothetical protein
VYENYTLFEADSPAEAMKIAESYALEYASIEDDLRLNGRSAYWKFEGIRKLIEVRDHLSDQLDVDKPDSGTEVSYSYMEFDNEEDIKDLAVGKRVRVDYIDSDTNE